MAIVTAEMIALLFACEATVCCMMESNKSLQWPETFIVMVNGGVEELIERKNIRNGSFLTTEKSDFLDCQNQS